ncbi:unnamed protein product [Pleuronectes platessa]|uniref:Uncharacterized protein n=1 Tax=Pleuronectes platessa TaxID=8262 RepID=A0A9N7YIT9_PLEPL|nr:unnamed protein product [Pleuronectes platessa]
MGNTPTAKKGNEMESVRGKMSGETLLSCKKLTSGPQEEAGRTDTVNCSRKLAGRLFHRARPCLGDTGSGEGRHDQPQEELEACCWREFSF